MVFGIATSFLLGHDCALENYQLAGWENCCRDLSLVPAPPGEKPHSRVSHSSYLHLKSRQQLIPHTGYLRGQAGPCLGTVPPSTKERHNSQRNHVSGKCLSNSADVSTSLGQPQQIGGPNTPKQEHTREAHALWISDQTWIIHCSHFKMQWVNF